MKYRTRFRFILSQFLLIFYLLTPLLLSAQNWITELHVSGNDVTSSLFIGGHPDATDGIDNGLDILAPPTPPTPTYSVYLLISHPVFPKLTTDMRAWIPPYTNTITWTLIIENGDGISSQITWDPSTLPTEGDFLFNGSVNMRTENSIDFLGNQTVTIQYQYVPTQQYHLSINVDPDGTGTVVKNPDKTSYHQGETVTLTPQSAEGYAFSHWSGDVSGNANPLILNINGDMVVTAHFGHSLNIQLEPTGGGSIQKIPNKTIYQHGETVTIKALPNQTFVFSHWDEDVHNTQTEITVIMNQNRTMTAHFGHILDIDVRDMYGSLTDSGTVLVSPDKQIYAHGENVQLTPLPVTGWSFCNWSGDASGNDSPLNITMNQNKSITAVFSETEEYVTVYIQSEPMGRIVQVDEMSYTTPCGFQWTINSTHTVGTESYQVLSGGHSRYHFDNWSDQGERNHNIYVTDSFILTAIFVLEHELRLESEFGSPFGAGWYSEGTTVVFGVESQVQHTENVRSLFFQWYGEGAGSYTGNDTSYSVIMNNPIQETASWDIQYYLSISVNLSHGGQVDPDVPGHWYDKDESVWVTAEPNAEDGYIFGGWTGDIENEENPFEIIMNEPKQITANFVKVIEYLVTTDPESLSIQVDGVEYISPCSFYWHEGSEHVINAISPQAGDEGVRYLYKAWSDGGSQTHVVVASSGDLIYKAYYQTQYYLSIFVNPPDWGSVIPELPGKWCEKDEEVIISAIANTDSGFAFIDWTGDLVSNEMVVSLTINNPVTITANFQLLSFPLTVHVEPSATGSVIRNPDKLEYYFGEVVSLKPNAYEGYLFDSWDGDLDGTDENVLITMDEEKTVVACFKKENFPPQIQMPDIHIFEDEIIKYSYGQLSMFFIDPNDYFNQLTIELINKSGFIQWSWNTICEELCIWPIPNWNGEDQIIVTVTDSSGASCCDSVGVTVQPVNDPPGDFTLISPMDHSGSIDRYDVTLFLWHQSMNVDEENGDCIKYTLYIGQTIPEYPVCAEIKDTTLSICSFDVLNIEDGHYCWSVKAKDKLGLITWSDTAWIIISDVENIQNDKIPKKFDLFQNYPNPFNPVTTIKISLPKSCFVSLKIYNLLGKELETLVSEYRYAGEYEVEWNAEDFPSGIYLYRLETEDYVKTKKLILKK